MSTHLRASSSVVALSLLLASFAHAGPIVRRIESAGGVGLALKSGYQAMETALRRMGLESWKFPRSLFVSWVRPRDTIVSGSATITQNDEVPLIAEGRCSVDGRWEQVCFRTRDGELHARKTRVDGTRITQYVSAIRTGHATTEAIVEAEPVEGGTQVRYAGRMLRRFFGFGPYLATSFDQTTTTKDGVSHTDATPVLYILAPSLFFPPLSPRLGRFLERFAGPELHPDGAPVVR
jgi:hypothetical protein